MVDTEYEKMQIVDSYLALNALRQVGYRSTATAIAELVDNSIEANADDIFVVTESRKLLVNTALSYQVEVIIQHPKCATFRVFRVLMLTSWESRSIGF